MILLIIKQNFQNNFQILTRIKYYHITQKAKMENITEPQFRSIILCDLLLYIDVTFWYLSIDLGLFQGSWFLHRHKIPHPNPMGDMISTKKYCLFKEYFRVVCFICIQVQNVLPSRSHPFCWYADKMQDKGFQPACLFQWLDLLADMTDEIEIEVLQHGGNHHENHVLSHKGKWQM